MEITLRLIDPATQLTDAMAVRLPVFVDEQGVPPEEERDAEDEIAVHVVAYDRETPVATGRFYHLDDTTVKIGRMAVLRDYRLHGIGSAVLGMLEMEARLAGATRAVLHAQVAAAAFYRLHGYEAEGETFEEAGLLHVKMHKTLA